MSIRRGGGRFHPQSAGCLGFLLAATLFATLASCRFGDLWLRPEAGVTYGEQHADSSVPGFGKTGEGDVDGWGLSFMLGLQNLTRVIEYDYRPAPPPDVHVHVEPQDPEPLPEPDPPTPVADDPPVEDDDLGAELAHKAVDQLSAIQWALAIVLVTLIVSFAVLLAMGRIRIDARPWFIHTAKRDGDAPD